jgi:hypothetical protein
VSEFHKSRCPFGTASPKLQIRPSPWFTTSGAV